MTAMQRRKGRKVQSEGLALLLHHDWEIIETSAGQNVEDACCIDPQGDWWSVEVKGDQAASVRSLWAQTENQAKQRGDKWTPLLLWRIDRGGWWAVVSIDTIGEQWVDRQGLFHEPPSAPTLTPPASMALPSIARWLVRADAAPMPSVFLADPLVAMPAWDALEALRWPA